MTAADYRPFGRPPFDRRVFAIGRSMLLACVAALLLAITVSVAWAQPAADRDDPDSPAAASPMTPAPTPTEQQPPGRAASAAAGEALIVGIASAGVLKILVFVFLAMGPLSVLVPFARMTRGAGTPFVWRLAVGGTGYAAILLALALIIGQILMQQGGGAFTAVALTAGVVLLLTALKGMLVAKDAYQESLADPGDELPPDSPSARVRVRAWAFAPLAFPIILSPSAIAIVILLEALRSYPGTSIFAFCAVLIGVLALNLLTMLFASRLMRLPAVVAFLGMFCAVLGLFQIALSLQMIVAALRAIGYGVTV
ncbi:MAG: MarC family protein [Burkholderiales bacterium]|nr:MarC family protein [Burkholderiales bacterium]